MCMAQGMDTGDPDQRQVAHHVCGSKDVQMGGWTSGGPRQVLGPSGGRFMRKLSALEMEGQSHSRVIECCAKYFARVLPRFFVA